MSNAIQDLWPDDVVVADVLSPLTIMRHQAGQLRARTKNLLEGEVKTSAAGNGKQHEFYVVAPALNRYRYLLFKVEHADEMVYPAKIIADCLVDPYEGFPSAPGQQEFVALLKDVMSDSSTKTVIHSLIAQINESKNEDDES